MVKRTFSIIAIGLLSIALVGCMDQESSSPVSSIDALSKTLDGDEGAWGPGFEGRPFGRLGGIVDLTDEQKEQIREIHNNRKETCGDPSACTDLTAEERKTKQLECREAMHNQVLAVLTPEQQATHKELKAQLDDGQIPDALVQKRVDHLTAMLNLTEEQQGQAFEIMKQTMQVRLDGRNKSDSSTFRMGHRGRKSGRRNGRVMKGPEGEMHTKLLEILSDDQKQVLEQMRTERQQKAGERRQQRQGNRVDRRLAKIVKVLELTEEQQSQIKGIWEAARTEARPDCSDPESCRAARLERMNAVHDQIKQVLTEEQIAKFDEMMETRGESRMNRQDRKGRRGKRG